MELRYGPQDIRNRVEEAHGIVREVFYNDYEEVVESVIGNLSQRINSEINEMYEEAKLETDVYIPFIDEDDRIDFLTEEELDRFTEQVISRTVSIYEELGFEIKIKAYSRRKRIHVRVGV